MVTWLPLSSFKTSPSLCFSCSASIVASCENRIGSGGFCNRDLIWFQGKCNVRENEVGSFGFAWNSILTPGVRDVGDFTQRLSISISGNQHDLLWIDGLIVLFFAVNLRRDAESQLRFFVCVLSRYSFSSSTSLFIHFFLHWTLQVRLDSFYYILHTYFLHTGTTADAPRTDICLGHHRADCVCLTQKSVRRQSLTISSRYRLSLQLLACSIEDVFF
jgi:hypothetical protein